MPKIPMGIDVGLGQAQYSRSVETPVLGRPVAKEVGPSLQVNKLDVVDEKAAPLSQIKPVLPEPGNEVFIERGLNHLEHHIEQLNTIQQNEIKRVNDAAEKTSLMVSMGDQKSSYRQNTLDVINNPDLSNQDKATTLKKLEDDFKATIGQVKPEYQPVVASEVMGTIGSVRAHAQDVFLKNQQDGIKANLETRTNQIILDAASSGDVNGALANHAALQGVYKTAGLTDAHFVQDHLKLEQTVLQNDIMGNVKSLDVKSGIPALESVNELLNKMNEKDAQGVPVNWTRLDPKTRNADTAELINKKNQIEADLLANSNKELTKLKSDFSAGLAYYTDALKNGDLIPSSVAISLRQQAQAMIQLDPDKTAGVMGLLSLQKVEQQYGPGHRAAEQAKDPLFGTGVRPISFQDVANPDALQAKFAENIKMGQMVKDSKGLTFVPVLRNADMEGISRTVEANPVNGILMVNKLKDALGQDGANSLTYLAGQMANSKDPAAPSVAAIIYNVAKGDANNAQMIANGMEVLRNKSITMPKDADLRDRFNTLMGDAMAQESANRGINFEAYKTAYASLAARKNIVDGSFDRDTGSEAFKRVVGTVTKWNGSSVLIPENMTESSFRDYLNSISPATVQAWGGISGMTPEKAADFIKDDATLRAVSPGRFAVMYEGRQAITTGGKQFIINVNSPILKPTARPSDKVVNDLSTGY
jgi:hypothetical protein